MLALLPQAAIEYAQNYPNGLVIGSPNDVGVST